VGKSLDHLVWDFGQAILNKERKKMTITDLLTKLGTYLKTKVRFGWEKRLIDNGIKEVLSLLSDFAPSVPGLSPTDLVDEAFAFVEAKLKGHPMAVIALQWLNELIDLYLAEFLATADGSALSAS
jgi:hypothetical protein